MYMFMSSHRKTSPSFFFFFVCVYNILLTSPPLPRSKIHISQTWINFAVSFQPSFLTAFPYVHVHVHRGKNSALFFTCLVLWPWACLPLSNVHISQTWIIFVASLRPPLLMAFPHVLELAPSSHTFTSDKICIAFTACSQPLRLYIGLLYNIPYAFLFPCLASCVLL